MFARSTTVIADPSLIDRGVALVRDEVMPALMRIDGCVGMSCLVERDTGRCVCTSAWRSQEAMRASEAQVGPQRNRMIDVFGAGQPLIQHWEIPVMHRVQPAPDGAFARLTWLDINPGNLDNAVGHFKRFMPELDGLSGFCSASMLINRDSGQIVSTTVYESRGAGAQHRNVGQGMRRRFAEQAAADVIEVAEFEVALAQLRVPELV